MFTFQEVTIPSFQIGSGLYDAQTKQQWMEKLMNAKLLSCDKLQAFASLENELIGEIQSLSGFIQPTIKAYKFAEQYQLAQFFSKYQNALIDLLDFKKRIISYHSSILEQYIAMLNDVLSHVKTGTIINNIGYYCQSPTELVGTVTTIDLIQHHLQELNDNKEQSCEEYKTALQELQNQDRKEVLITLLKDITVLDKDSFQEIPHNETTQTHFNQFIFDLNHSIGINLYTFLSNTSDNLCESIPPLIHSISKELIDTYELDFPFIYQILYVLLQRSIFPRLYSSLKTIHTNELSILDSSFKELQQQIQINPTLLQFTHIDKIQSNPKLIQLAHSTHFNQQYVPYDFLLYLNELITDITSNYDDIITGENLMCVVVWVLVNSSINDVNLLNAYLKQYTPKWMLKGKLSYCTTTYEASIQLILQNIQVQE